MLLFFRYLAVAATFALLISPERSSAGAAAGCVSVTVVTIERKPVPGAVVTFAGAGPARTVRSDDAGSALVCGLEPGAYSVGISARGYGPLTVTPIDVGPAGAVPVTFVLGNSTALLTTIGTVRTRGAAGAVSSAPALETQLDAQRYAALGYASIAGALMDEALSATTVRAAGGSSAGPIAVALRGPDPTETLVDVDGHAVNGGATGTFDLSLLDLATFSGVQLIYGIAPSSLIGPNTIGGVINLRTLDPTSDARYLVRASFGSFGTAAQTVQATGSRDRIGYAFALHHTYAAGEVNQYVDAGSAPVYAGSAASGASGLAKLTYSSPGGAFAAFSIRDQSETRDLSAALTSLNASGSLAPYTASPGSATLAHAASYAFDAGIPVGRPNADGISPQTLTFRHVTSVASQSVTGAAAGSTPYLNDDRDAISDDSLELDRAVRKGTISAKLAVWTEALGVAPLSVAPTDQSVFRKDRAGAATLAQVTGLAQLSQMQRSGALRYALDTTPQLHYALSIYYADYSSFGTSLDPRFGFVWTPNASTALRFSAGSSFQSPQLPELYVPPTVPPPSNGYVNIGNPNLKADHATEYSAGLERAFGGRLPLRVSVDLYQTNLRTPAQRFYPPVACPPLGNASPSQCLSYPVNAGGAIYRGAEISSEAALSSSTALRAAYDVGSAFATSVSPEFQNGSIVPGEQFQGVPLHKGLLELSHDCTRGLAYRVGMTYEGAYNELNRPAFATVRAGLTLHVRDFDAGVYGDNLTNAYAGPFTLAGQGVPYGGADGPIATDAYVLPARSFTFLITARH